MVKRNSWWKAMCRIINVNDVTLSFTIHLHVYIYVRMYVFWVIFMPIQLVCFEHVEQWTLVLLMEEILHHLGCVKPYKWWDIYHITLCRISSISSISRHYEVPTFLWFLWVQSELFKERKGNEGCTAYCNVAKVLDCFSNFQHMVRVRILFNQSLVACWLVA